MKQKEHIEALLKRDEFRKILFEKIQLVYETYLQNGNAEQAGEIFPLLSEYCEWYVRKNCTGKGRFSIFDEEDVLQKSRTDIWNCMKQDRENGKIRNGFAYFCFQIYKFKLVDLYRESKKRQEHVDEYGMQPISEEKPVSKAELERSSPGADQVFEKEQLRYLYKEVFLCYCQAMVNLEKFPGRHLALFYARILPHLDKAIKDTKAASAKWAFERMGNHTFGVLSEEAQQILTARIHSSLVWCSGYMKQINDMSNIKGCNMLLRDIVYTSVYNKGKIENWSESTHRTVLNAANKQIALNKQLNGMLIAYCQKSDKVLSSFVKGGLT